MHNAAIADERYGRLTSAPTRIGTEVLTNAEYVLAALDLLAVAGLRLAFTGWTALFPDLTHNASLMTLHVVRRHLLDKSAWRASVAICSFLAERCDSVPTRGVGQVHSWYARKQLDGLESIRTELETWVPQSADFALARLALLDRHHEALALARELLAGGALTRIDMRASPVLAWLVAELDGDAADVSAPAPA